MYHTNVDSYSRNLPSPIKLTTPTKFQHKRHNNIKHIQLLIEYQETKILSIRESNSKFQERKQKTKEAPDVQAQLY